MSLVAREAVASDHLVYLWPYPVGASVEVSCGNDEVAVMCPAWAVATNLGPGRHTYHSPDPSRPTAVYFVLTGPVEVDFDMMAQFTMPGSGQPVMLRAQGSVLVRVSDPALMVAQFVGLPFERVNDGLVRSVSASVERMLGKLLPRKAALAGTLAAVADPAQWPALVEELSSYNPAVGAVHGVSFVRFKQFAIMIGDHNGWTQVPQWNHTTSSGGSASSVSAVSSGSGLSVVSGEIGGSSDSTEKGAVPSNPALAPPPQSPPLPAGTWVLVALADGLFHSATVLQALQGYYELDVGGNGETVWVPMDQVAPQV